MAKNKKAILILLFFIIVISLLAVFLPKNYHSENIFTVIRGESLKEISTNLEKAGLVYWGPVFRAYVLVLGDAKKIKAGTYLFSSSMDLSEIVDKFVAGDIAKEKITFPEGFDAEQIYQKISGITQVNLADLQTQEGYLFPDTYQIPYGATSQDIIKMMTDNFARKTPGLKFTKEDIVMASIIEKEVITKEDKALVSGLLWKRLRAGMPLQVDVAPETYQTKGLPKNPICNPGLESIEAAVSPKASQYWYYLSTPEGKTIFSKTLDEHNIAKAKYLK
jgi:UPF0755 protein